MSLETDIYQLVKGPHGSTSPGFAARVYPDILPENVSYPAALYEVESVEYGEDMDGDNRFDQAFVRVSVYAKTRAELSSDVSYLRDNLHGFSGSSFTSEGDTISLSNNIQGISASANGSSYELGVKVYAQDVELEIHIKN